MKYFIVTGEASGDLHGANLIHHICLSDNQVVAKGFGGIKLKNEGVEIIKDIKELSLIGFVEVLFNIRKIINNFALCKKSIIEFAPDIVILIDYPGFNLRLSKWLHKRHFKVAYYILPQLWAWKASRIKKIRKYVDVKIPILPFEKEYYDNRGIETIYCGHPLLDEVEKHIDKNAEKKHIALLPGSRKTEIKKMLPVYCEVAKENPSEQFVVAAMSLFDPSFYNSLLHKTPANLIIETDNTLQILNHAKAAIVTSGTATLETAFLNIPQIVCYKTNPITYLLAKKLAKVRYISLVNIILSRDLVKELIQSKCTKKLISDELYNILNNNLYKEKILSGYEEIRKSVGKEGASARAASAIISNL